MNASIRTAPSRTGTGSVRPSTLRFGLALAVLAAPLLQGCVSQAGYRQAISDREAEIRNLREERASLKGQVQKLKGDLDQARLELAQADAAPKPAAPVEADAQRFPELDSLGIGYGLRNGQMVISIPSSITFPSGRAELSKEGQKALHSVADTLKRQYPSGSYFVEGHTDSDPIQKSKFESNRDLSLARAMAVLTYMVEDCGVPDEQCTVVGHGQYQPVAPNTSAADKARNRRVEIVVSK
jgi:chemotaxis protein MotB